MMLQRFSRGKCIRGRIGACEPEGVRQLGRLAIESVYLKASSEVLKPKVQSSSASLLVLQSCVKKQNVVFMWNL